MLRASVLGALCFSVAGHCERGTVSCIPLPGESAFVCNAQGTWLPLEVVELSREMAYLGARYAPGNPCQMRTLGQFRQARRRLIAPSA